MLTLDQVSKVYEAPDGPLPILRDVSLALDAGDACAIVGPSGSGKSTLLHVLGTLDAPTSGRVTFDGTNPFALDETALAMFRNAHIGFVFQDHCLLPQCTVLENVLTPTLVASPRPADATGRARHLLDRVGLGHRLAHRPAELTGGEKQRVAIARALVNDPRLVLCDEPTGNLDHRSADTVADLLLELHASRRGLLVVVTHSTDLARRFARRYQIVEGALTTTS